MEPGRIIIIDEYCSSPLIQRIAERLLEARQEVVIIGAGMSIPRNLLSVEDRMSLLETAVKPKSLIDQISFKRSGYPEYGHYRVDFRTGKPLRW